jgi:hypothetical protein
MDDLDRFCCLNFDCSDYGIHDTTSPIAMRFLFENPFSYAKLEATSALWTLSACYAVYGIGVFGVVSSTRLARCTLAQTYGLRHISS